MLQNPESRTQPFVHSVILTERRAALIVINDDEACRGARTLGSPSRARCHETAGGEGRPATMAGWATEASFCNTLRNRAGTSGQASDFKALPMASSS